MVFSIGRARLRIAAASGCPMDWCIAIAEAAKYELDAPAMAKTGTSVMVYVLREIGAEGNIYFCMTAYLRGERVMDHWLRLGKTVLLVSSKERGQAQTIHAAREESRKGTSGLRTDAAQLSGDEIHWLVRF